MPAGALPQGRRLLAGLALLAGLNVGPASAAGERAATGQVEATLLASVAAVAPGQEILLGVQQKIIPHWHTYWKNPGDSGEATRIAWQLPAGGEVGEIRWPTPSRFSLGPVGNYGYADEVTLLAPLKVPASAAPGSRLPVRATVDWLVCEETCIPQQVELAIELPVVAAGTPNGPGEPLIAAAQARLRAASPWPVRLGTADDGLRLKIHAPELAASTLKEVWFYAEEWGRVAHVAAQPATVADGELVLALAPGEAPLQTGQPLRGVLAVTETGPNGAATRGFALAPLLAAASATPDDSLWSALLFALLGGIVLNLMPCVFPVLSIKALALLQHARQSPGTVRRQGLAYTAGVLASFALLAGLLIALKLGGARIGWGFQYQSPLFVLLVANLMFAVGLNLSGLFEFGAGVAGLGGALAERDGYLGSFFTGVLATIVATPCTAPFMGAAIGFALGQPPAVLLAVFLSLGLGLALPYLLLCVWPGLQRLLPRPGPWMERLRQGLAFPMYGAAVWLVWVLARQAGSDAVAIALSGMVVVAFAAWLYGQTRQAGRLVRHGGAWFASLAVAGTLLGGGLGIEAAPAEASPARGEGRAVESYSGQRLAELRAAGRPVFLNFTAAWCISCLVNEKVALGTATVGEAFARRGVTYLKGDWTRRDAEITAVLARHGRSGAPLYLYYPPGAGAKPVILPQILTPDIVLAALDAGPSPSAIPSPIPTKE